MRRKHTDIIRALAEYETATANHLDRAEIDRLLSHKQSVVVSYQTELRLYEERHQLLQNELTSLNKQLHPITLLSAASNQRHFFLTSEDYNMGYNPVQHPQQKLFNLPLSLLNVFKYPERVWYSKSMLKTVLIIFIYKTPTWVGRNNWSSLSINTWVSRECLISYKYNRREDQGFTGAQEIPTPSRAILFCCYNKCWGTFVLLYPVG